MPASRRARAMIFAPRSWPSRPGFAITTRIFRSTVGKYKEVRLVVVGCSPAWPNPGGAQSGYLVEGRGRLLLDCGPWLPLEGRERLARLGELLGTADMFERTFAVREYADGEP